MRPIDLAILKWSLKLSVWFIVFLLVLQSIEFHG